MEIPKTDLQRMALDEFMGLQNLTCYPPAFQKELPRRKRNLLGEAFASPETVDDDSKRGVEGVLPRQDKRGKDAWNEFAPKWLKEFPLAAEGL